MSPIASKKGVRHLYANTSKFGLRKKLSKKDIPGEKFLYELFENFLYGEDFRKNVTVRANPKTAKEQYKLESSLK